MVEVRAVITSAGRETTNQGFQEPQTSLSSTSSFNFRKPPWPAVTLQAGLGEWGKSSFQGPFWIPHRDRDNCHRDWALLVHFALYVNQVLKWESPHFLSYLSFHINVGVRYGVLSDMGQTLGEILWPDYYGLSCTLGAFYWHFRHVLMGWE